ncbi:MAG: hypothetical protein CME88_09655 [Hirschia sp.]|nr:hypothetical protein [Hirschia sp.]MBF18631.1 hypothetical protein [Hirschia sp.]|tara:strand:+ start:1469 stop:2059 length:591 start_codon:yes stop_codon:yes gene_type:complete
MRHEVLFEPHDPLGPDLHYSDKVEVSGQLRAKQLRKFANARRSRAMGPTTIYYAGVTAPAVSAGMGTIAYWTFDSIYWPAQWTLMGSTILAAMAGISWYIVFMRLGKRTGIGRNGELQDETRIIVDDSGVDVTRGHVRTLVGWNAVCDITISRKYIALIIDGANDILLPIEWFEDEAAMKDAARKISSLRPPPFSK